MKETRIGYGVLAVVLFAVGWNVGGSIMIIMIILNYTAEIMWSYLLKPPNKADGDQKRPDF